jgi:hypothetical protein
MRKSIFHEDWWLDALAPGRWREVTCLRGGRVAGRLRFVERSETGMKICEMPQITRILGPVVTPETNKREARSRSTHAIITELLHQVAGYKHVEMILDTGFTDLAPFLHAGYAIKVHPTLHLDCNQRAEDLWAGLRDKVRNSVRRARERLIVGDIDDVELFVDFYRKNLVGEDPYFDLSLLTSILATARERQQCRIVAAFDDKGEAHAMTVFIWDDEYVYYFLSSRKRDVAHAGAVSLLVWIGIELAHSRALRFDFDGGIMKDSRYKFLISFGGELASRFEVVRSTSLYRAQRTIRRIPRALFRKLSRLGGKSGRMEVFIGICWAHLIACCWRASNSIQMGECII